uniref:Myocilin n=1 Tax=Oncorhynchus tshawytscha TaxID=74940 RepID=A0A8C8LQF2_ONCTS
MWLPQNVVALCLSCLVLSTHGRDRVSLRRSNDHTGRCQYTFTVDNPDEASFYKAEVTEIPASRLIQEAGQNHTDMSCYYHSAAVPPRLPLSIYILLVLVSVGEPVLHRKVDSVTGKYGVWLNKTVWRIDTVGKDVRQLFAHEDMEQFAKGFSMKVLVLPVPVESTGATLYRDSLYYQRRHRRNMHRYDLAFESLAGRLELPYAGFHGQHPYSWGVYTDIDLAVNEQCPWAIYSPSKAKGAIVASQLDPESLEVKRSWETNIRKNTVANIFVISGWVYTVASYTAPDTTVNHVFDTATGQGRGLAVPFKNHYRYNSMVDFNHAQRKLYAWVNFHMITYNVRLEAG